MAWVRLDDNFHWHPKVAPLSDAAYRLYVGALCHCNRYDQGDHVSLGVVTALMPGRRGLRSAAELVTATLWLVDGVVGWIIHDYFSYQPNPDKQRAGRIGGQASAQARAQASAVAPAQALLNPRTRTRPVGVENPSVGSPPNDETLTIASRGWRGGAESTGEILERFKRPEVVS